MLIFKIIVIILYSRIIFLLVIDRYGHLSLTMATCHEMTHAVIAKIVEIEQNKLTF